MSEEPQTPLTSSSVLRSARWNSIGQSMAQGIRFVAVIVLASILSPEEFGLMAMALVVMGMLNLFQNMGTMAAIIQKQDLTPDLLHSVYWMNVLVGLFLAAILWLTSGVIADIFDDARLAPLLAFLALGFAVFGFGSVPQALLHRRMMFRQAAFVQIATVVVYAVLALTLAYYGYGVWSIVIAHVVQSILTAVLFLAIAMWRPRFHFAWSDISSIFSFSANLTAFDVLNYLLFNADRFIVGRYLGAGALGIYDLANRLCGYVVRFFLPALMRVLFPAMARIADDDERLNKALLRAMAGMVLVFAPTVAGIAAISDIFIEVVFDPRWSAVTLLIPILAVRYLLELILRIVAVLYRVKGRTDLLLYWGIGSGAVFVLSYVVGLQWGIVGVAVAQSLAMCALTYPALRIPLSLTGLPIRRVLVTVVPHLLACAVMVIAVRVFLTAGTGLALTPSMQLFCAVGLGAAVYGAAILLMRAAGVKDLLFLVRGERRST